MNKKVAVTGVGSTKFSVDDIPLEDVLLNATKSLFDQNPNISKNEIDGVLVSTNANSNYLAAVIGELSGIKPKISHSVESLCSSGTNTIVSAYSYIAAGLAKTVLVVGGERYNSPGQILQWDNSRGEFKHPIFWASLFTKAYKREFAVSEEDLGHIAVKNHKHAQDNPYAISKKQYSLEDVMNSKRLTEDLKLLDCSRPCTGGSAVLLASEDVVKQNSLEPVWIKGVGQKTISASFTKNPTLTSMTSTKEAAQFAFNMAHVAPSQIDVAEVHDAFTVCEPLALESTGIARKGKGTQLAKEMYETDNKKINPRGGILGSGHPLGATGIAQTAEVAQQLLGSAGRRQVDSHKIGMVHNMSAGATSSTVLVMES